MNEDQTILSQILAATMRSSSEIGSLRTEVRNLTANVTTYALEAQAHGTQLAQLQPLVAAHGRKISELCKKLDVAEPTLRMHINEEVTRWKTLRVLGALLLGLGAVSSAAVGLYRCGAGTKAQAAASAARR